MESERNHKWPPASRPKAAQTVDQHWVSPMEAKPDSPLEYTPRQTEFSHSLADIQEFFRSLKCRLGHCRFAESRRPINTGVVYGYISGFDASVDPQGNPKCRRLYHGLRLRCDSTGTATLLAFSCGGYPESPTECSSHPC